MTAQLAAEILDITPYSVWRLLREGKLKGEKFGTSWMVDKASVSEYKERNKDKAPQDPTRG